MLMDLSNSRGPLSTVLFSFPCSAATVHNKNKQKSSISHGPKISSALSQIKTHSRKLVWIGL